MAWDHARRQLPPGPVTEAEIAYEVNRLFAKADVGPDKDGEKLTKRERRVIARTRTGSPKASRPGRTAQEPPSSWRRTPSASGTPSPAKAVPHASAPVPVGRLSLTAERAR
jgi:hypothetical protein